MRMLPSLAATACLLAFAAAPSRAATASASPAAPVVDGEDIANYAEVTGTEKWFTENSSAGAAKGQSFVTGSSAVRLKSISYQVASDQKAMPTKTYAIRVGKLAGQGFSVVHSETATQSAAWNSGEFMTWTFATPVLLEPYTTYGIDVGMLSSTSTWQTGIPYLNVTADDYADGTRYSSGTNGTGNASVSYAIGSDRIFHLDLERPLGPVFTLVGTLPADNATDALATRELILTFSQPVSAGSGSITFRDLTDPANPTEVSIAANDPRISYEANTVRIDPAGLLGWQKAHAIRISAGAFLGDGGAPIAAITDDVSWNFSTVAGDPLLDAIAALKAHVTSSQLSGAQIAAHKSTIDAAKSRFAESPAMIRAVFDLVKTYDAVRGPLFVSGSAVTGFSRNNTTPTSNSSISPENFHWAIYTVMQAILDEVYTAKTLANSSKRAVLINFLDPGGFKFGSHVDFPGPCAPPANPANTHTVPINGSFPATFGRATQQWTLPARKPTGTYLAPGTLATVTVPPALVNAGYKVRVGAHSWDLSGRPPVERLERATSLFPLTAPTIEVASPYGGGIYVEVPPGAEAGIVQVTITGAVRAPYFSAKPFHQTTPAQWNIEKSHPAPWADFQSEKFMMQVPRKWIYNHPDPAQLMADWDKAMDAINSLMGFPLDRGKETMYCQPDVILRSSVHAPGYPAVNVTTNPNAEVSPAGYSGHYLVRGPGASPTAAHIEFHEQGHAYFFPKFGGETESNVNLLQPAMLHRKFNYSLDVAHAGSLGSASVHRTLDNTAVAWMCVFNFSPRKVPMAEAEKAYQHKGHAKFLDVVRLYGWQGLDAYWRSFMEDDAAGISYSTTTDALLLRLCRAVGKDLRPLFHFWGIFPQNNATLAAALAAENIPADPAIRTLLLQYKSLVPANNSAFRTFALNWWGKQPTMAGAWEEREHARQWDTTANYGTGDQQRSEATNPGEIYNEVSASDIRSRVDELVALYFPSGIAPDPMGFAETPNLIHPTTLRLTATTATAPVGPVQYLFENITTGARRDWSEMHTWDHAGLSAGQTYAFRVKARNGLGEETAWSPLQEAVLATPYDQWAGGFAQLSDPNPVLDADGGGLANSLEWVLGGDPTLAGDDAAMSPTLSAAAGPDGKRRFTYRRSAAARNDPATTLTVEYSSNLSSWTTAAHQGEAAHQISITEEPDGFGPGIDRVTVALPENLTAGGPSFVRLRVRW